MGKISFDGARGQLPRSPGNAIPAGARSAVSRRRGKERSWHWRLLPLWPARAPACTTVSHSWLARSGQVRRTKYEHIPDSPTRDRPVPRDLRQQEATATARTRYATRETVPVPRPVPAMDVVPDHPAGRVAATQRHVSPDRRSQADLPDRRHADGQLGPGPASDDRGSAQSPYATRGRRSGGTGCRSRAGRETA